MTDDVLTYELVIGVSPDEMDIDAKDEILAAAEPHDEDDGLRRYLGDKLNDVEDQLNSLLPEGMWAKIKEVRT